MNREISFRIWHEETNKFYYMYLDEMVGMERVVSIPPNSIIEQYTGCNDKNGKSIYEGDIIEYSAGDTIRKGHVSFIAGGFFVNWPDQTDDFLGEMLIEKMNVVGNIHENKKVGWITGDFKVIVDEDKVIKGLIV